MIRATDDEILRRYLKKAKNVLMATYKKVKILKKYSYHHFVF